MFSSSASLLYENIFAYSEFDGGNMPQTSCDRRQQNTENVVERSQKKNK